MDYSYKQLSSKDIEILRDLITVFGHAFGETETYQSTAPSDAYLESLLNNPSFITLAAMSGEKVVGGLTAYELTKFEQERKEIYIYDLAVSADHRRQGLATNLINELKKLAKARGAYIIFVQADLEDEPAIKLYESFSKRQTVYQFDIPVE